MRSELVHQVARSFGVVLSRRAGVAVGLWGEPGIGKTFTAQAILKDVPCPNLSLHATTSAADIARALPRGRKVPAWAEGQLERLLGDEPFEPRALAQVIAGTLAGAAPFVLYLEDVHEANPERLEMIAQLALAINSSKGVGLLVTSRREPPEGFRHHRLELLESSETQTLLEQQLGASLPDEGREWLQSRTHGNPLFALEYLRYLTRQGFLWSDGQRWNWRAPTNDFVPVTLEALIGQLTANLADSPQARAVLEARAVLSSELEAEHLHHAWAAVAGMDQRTLKDVRQGLEQSGLLRGPQFAHPLFGEVIAHELPALRRRALARRALEVLEPINPVLAAGFIHDAGLEANEAMNRLERTARQLQAAGNAMKAGQLLALAADHASGERQATLALEAARHLQDRDIPESERLARLAMQSQPHRKEATLLCASTVMRRGDSEGAWALLETLPEADRNGIEWWRTLVQFHNRSRRATEVLRLWNEHPEFHDQAPVGNVCMVVTALVDLGEIERANRLIDAALARSDLTPLERGTVLDRRNAIYYREARYEDIERNLTALLESVDENEHPFACHNWYANRSNARVRLGRMQEAKADAEKACKLLLATGSRSRYAGLLVKLALTQIYLDEFEEAERVLLEAVSFAQAQHAEELWDCYGHLSFLYLRWKPPHGPMLTRRYAQLALQETRKLGRPDIIISSLEDCVRAELGCGSPQAALEYARELEAMARQTGLEQDLLASNALMGRALAAVGDHRAALPYLRRASAMYEAHGQHGEALISELVIDRFENNIEAARQKLEWFEAQGDTHHASRVIEQFPELRQAPAPSISLKPPGTRVEVLGPIRLVRDGQPVQTRARKRFEIIAYLLEARIAGKIEVSLLDLLDAFYPDEPEDQGKNTLKQQVYKIRADLGPESIHSTSNGYALGAVTSDAEDFLEGGDSSLWREAYLEGLGEGWIASVRDALTLALRARVESLLERDANESVRLGRILCKLEPYDPDVLRLTVRAMRAAGEDRAATRLFGEHRELLLELGEPVPATLEAFLA